LSCVAINGALSAAEQNLKQQKNLQGVGTFGTELTVTTSGDKSWKQLRSTKPRYIMMMMMMMMLMMMQYVRACNSKAQ